MIVKALKNIFLKSNNLFLWYIRKYVNYILPNALFILRRKVNYIEHMTCSQKMYLTGQGTIHIEDNCTFGEKFGGHYRWGCIELQTRGKDSKIKIGSNVATNNNLFLCASNYIEIGSFSLIGQNVTIMDFEAHGISPNKRRGGFIKIGKVIIGKNVWIGNNVTILKNSIIGENSIIATGAVVSGKFPENVIIGGIPAKIIKHIDD